MPPSLRLSRDRYFSCRSLAHPLARFSRFRTRRSTTFDFLPSHTFRSCTSTVTERGAQVIRSRNRPSLYPVYRNHSSADVFGEIRGIVRRQTRPRVKICRSPSQVPPGDKSAPSSDTPLRLHPFVSPLSPSLPLALRLSRSQPFSLISRVAIALTHASRFHPCGHFSRPTAGRAKRGGLAFSILQVILSRRKREPTLPRQLPPTDD